MQNTLGSVDSFDLRDCRYPAIPWEPVSCYSIRHAIPRHQMARFAAFCVTSGIGFAVSFHSLAIWPERSNPVPAT